MMDLGTDLEGVRVVREGEGEEGSSVECGGNE